MGEGSPERARSGFRRSYAEEPELSAVVFELLEEVFPGIGTTAAHAASMGAPWESVSQPYLLFEGQRAVAHVGVIELQLMIRGRIVTVGSVHAVATHPERRRTGLFRQLMTAVLEDCRDRYAALVLTTENPEYYEPFGFRVVQEHEFRIDPPAFVPPAPSLPRPQRMRSLDIGVSTDLQLLHRLLETRAPVSRVGGVSEEKAVFCFNEGRGPLWYAADLDALCVFTSGSGRLDLYDVVAPAIPTLREIVERLPTEDPPAEAVIHFSPDRLGVGYEVAGNPPGGIGIVPRIFEHDGPSYLMVCGDPGLSGAPFSLPRPART